MGFFDLLNPAFDLVDAGMASLLSPGWRLALWALAGAALTMGLYRLTSNQERMGQTRTEIRAAQRELSTFDGELDEMMPLIRRTIGLSLHQLRLSLGPALIASLPLIFLLAWVSNRFSTELPRPGTSTPVTLMEPAAGLSWNSPDAISTDNGWLVPWPEAGRTLTLAGSGGDPVLTLPLNAASPVVHQRQWWNVLIGNPAGYLPDDAPVDSIHIDLPQREYLPFGPTWARGAIAVFIAWLFLFSLTIKLAFRIH